MREKILNGFVDTHIHTGPDVNPRLMNDFEAALDAKEAGLKAIVIKSHVEPTASRAQIAQKLTGIQVVGGITLNQGIGGLNPDAVHNMVNLGGKIVWLPTIHHQEIKTSREDLEEILNIIASNHLVLGTGHLSPEKIFGVLDQAKSQGVKKIIVNHPLTKVVSASLDEQKEMARHAYLEHCWVATMPQHDLLEPEIIVEAIEEVGDKHCILATDFGQAHNPSPVMGMEMMIKSLTSQGIPWKSIETMCRDNPGKLIF